MGWNNGIECTELVGFAIIIAFYNACVWIVKKASKLNWPASMQKYWSKESLF